MCPINFGVKQAQDAWTLLKNELKGCEKIISTKLQNLWREFDNLTLKDSELVKYLLSRVAKIINQIKSCGDTIPQKKILEKFHRSLM